MVVNKFEQALDKGIKDKEKSQIIVDKTELENLKNKYPAVNPKEIEKKINNKCEYYSRMSQETLEEKFGFEDGKKGEFIEGIKDTITLIQLDYKEPQERIKEKIMNKEIRLEELIYESSKINVLDDMESIELGTWAKIKKRMLKLNKERDDLFFISHKEDEIVGKPERIYNIKQKVILIIRAIKNVAGESGAIKINYKFLDDNYDKRFDGYEDDVLGFHFWIYRIVENGIEYIVLSQKELSPQQHRLRGMKIDLKDSSELTKTLRIKTISDLFLVVEDEPSIKPMPKEELINYFKKLDITQEEFIEYLYTHPQDKKVYSHTKDYSKIRIYQELSGKYEGYPLHLMIWGDVGRGKTMELECIRGKFEEEKGIFEAGSSTLKGLIPSFKEKPANIGYLLKCLRRALVDEINKMIDRTTNYEVVSEYLGQLNFILEHKDREVGSGNDNELRTQATAKITFATNRFGNKRYLYEHIGLLDSTTLSRMLHLVVNKDEYDYIQNNRLEKSQMDKISNNQFLSIYDSCQSFLVDFDEEKVRAIFLESLKKAREFKEVWKARGLHHSILLLDGIVKFRCLFWEDNKFKAKSEDYVELKRVLEYLMESWKYPLKMGWEQGENL